MTRSAAATAGAIASFDAEAALKALERAFETVGVSCPGEMRLLQAPSDNAVVHIPALGLVARIAASAAHRERLGRELATSAHLAACGVPVTVTAPDPPTPQLLVACGRVVSWWVHEDACGNAGYEAHGAALAELHRVPVPDWLPTLDPWARTDHQIALAARALPAVDIDALLRHRERLAEAWASSPFARPGPRVVVHGDPYIGNSMRTADRPAVLCDFEDTAAGTAGWDFASLLGAHQLGWVSEADWAAFCRGYGRDLSDAPGMNVLVDVLAYRRACWLASTTTRHTDRIAKARHRIATLHLPLRERGW